MRRPKWQVTQGRDSMWPFLLRNWFYTLLAAFVPMHLCGSGGGHLGSRSQRCLERKAPALSHLRQFLPIAGRPQRQPPAADRYSFPSLSSQQDLLEGRGCVKGARFLRGEADPLTQPLPSIESQWKAKGRRR